MGRICPNGDCFPFPGLDLWRQSWIMGKIALFPDKPAADPDRGWDAIVVGEYERAFYGSQYASMAPLFEHYGVSLWMPEVGGRVDWHAEDHEQTMLALGLSSKREVTRTRIRIRTAMAAQTLEQGRYLGGRPRLAGHSAARITRALNDAGVPCPSASDPGPQPAPHRSSMDSANRRRDPGQPPLHGPAGVEPAADRLRPDRPGRHQPRAPAGAAVESARRLGHLHSSRARGTGQRGRLRQDPGHDHAARPGRPGCTALPAGRSPDMQAVRAAP